MKLLSQRVLDALPGVAVLVLMLAAIELATQRNWINGALLPAPSRIAAVLAEIIASGDFIRPLAATLGHLACGFAIGATFGVVLGMAMGYWQAVYMLLEPLVEFVRPLPKPALVPALILFLGVDDAMKNTSVALAVFFPILLNTIQGVSSVDRTLVDTGRTFGYGNASIICKIVMPAAVPYILAGMRVSLGLGLILAVLSEMMAGNNGLGFLIVDMQRAFRVRQMYAWLIILAIVGYGLNALIVWIERRMLNWRPVDVAMS